MIYWLNGDFHTEKEMLRIDDRGFLLGDGIFETMLVRNGSPAFWDRHMARLSAGLSELHIDVDVAGQLGGDGNGFCQNLATKNDLGNADASLRIAVSRGSGPRGIGIEAPMSPTVIATIAPAPMRGPGFENLGRHLHVSRYRRPAASVTSRIKTPAYLDNILALKEAVNAGRDEALMLNEAGRVSCASTANIFLLGKDGTITTPPIDEGALPGIVRAVLIDECRKNGVTVKEEPIELGEVQLSDFALTNSLIGAIPARLDHRPEAPGEVFNQFNAWYQAALCDDLNQRASVV